MNSKFTSTKLVTYFSSAFFIVVGLINLVHSIFVFSDYNIRDLIILITLSLPLFINKKIFFLLFGGLASVISIVIFFIHLFNFPDEKQISILMYISGFFIYALSLCSGLGMIYIGTFSSRKNTFSLV